MSRKIRMMLYGTAGVGKSVFAFQFPKPLFITSDNNYAELVPFGADLKDHRQAFTFAEFVKLINDDKLLADYETIVVDLVEDFMKFAETDYVNKHKLEHIGDVGHGKGYSITRNDFFVEISKLLAKDKHVILLAHEDAYTVKDRRGVESWVYKPSGTIPDKVLEPLMGRLRFVLRAYFQDEVKTDGSIVQHRLLSLVPKTGEMGVIRGVNTTTIPNDIPLSPSIFFETIETHKPDLNFIKHVEERPKIVDAKAAGKKAKEDENKKLSIKEKLEAAKAEEVVEIKELVVVDEGGVEVDLAQVNLVETETGKLHEPDVLKEPEVVTTIEPKVEVKPEVKPKTGAKPAMLAIQAKLNAVKAGLQGTKLNEVVELMIESGDTSQENAIKIVATLK